MVCFRDMVYSQRCSILLSVRRLATDICDKDYGNCTNPCAAVNKECCYCEMSQIGPTKVCSCCPQVREYTVREKNIVVFPCIHHVLSANIPVSKISRRGTAPNVSNKLTYLLTYYP